MSKRYLVSAALFIAVALMVGVATTVSSSQCQHKSCAISRILGTFYCEEHYGVGTNCQIRMGGMLCSTLNCSAGDPPGGVWWYENDDGTCDVWDPALNIYRYQSYCDIDTAGPN